MIKTALQLAHSDESWIKRNLSISGLKLVKELKGIPCFPLNDTPPPKKNICTSRSFGSEVNSLSELKESVSSFASMCASKLRRQKSVAKRVSVFIYTNPFKVDRNQYNAYQVLELPTATNDTLEIVQMALKG